MGDCRHSTSQLRLASIFTSTWNWKQLIVVINAVPCVLRPMEAFKYADRRNPWPMLGKFALQHGLFLFITDDSQFKELSEPTINESR